MIEGGYNQSEISKISYYISIGYSNLYSIEFNRLKGYKQILGNPKLQKAKNYCRMAIKVSGSCDSKFKSRIIY